MFRRPKINPLGQDGQVRCPKHNILAVLRTSHQPASQNRKFWTCPGRPLRGSPGENTDADCDFFYWENEIIYPDSPPTPMSPTTPSRIHSPTKRSASYFMTPDAKAKRLKAIQDALPSSSSIHTDAPLPPSPTRPPGPNPPESTTSITSSSSAIRRARLAEEIRNSLLQTPQSHDIPSSFTSSTATSRVDDTHIHSRTSAVYTNTSTSGQIIYNPSELNPDLGGAPGSPRGTSTSTGGGMTYNLSELNLDLSGPRIKVSRPPRNANGGESDGPSKEGGLLDFFVSPPRPRASSPDEVAADLLPSSDMSMDKGKQRAIVLDQEEEVFWTSPPSKSISHQNYLLSPSTPSQPEESQPQPQPHSHPQSDTEVSLRIQTSVPITPTSASNLTSDQVQTLIQDLSGIPECVKKLERKLLAMQKSNESKARRIKELEAEVQELKSHRMG